MKQYYLTAQYDSRKEFYGKAMVEELDNGDLLLKSYLTPVCLIRKSENKPYIGKYFKWSNTTLRHIKEFLKQNDFFEEAKSATTVLNMNELDLRY